jgi:hypothetical protein
VNFIRYADDFVITGRTPQDPVLCPKIFVPQQEFLTDRSGDVGHHPRPKHFGFPLDLPPSESEIVDAVFQPEKPIRGEPVESCKLRYFNSFEFFDHTGILVLTEQTGHLLVQLVDLLLKELQRLSSFAGTNLLSYPNG